MRITEANICLMAIILFWEGETWCIMEPVHIMHLLLIEDRDKRMISWPCLIYIRRIHLYRWNCIIEFYLIWSIFAITSYSELFVWRRPTMILDLWTTWAAIISCIVSSLSKTVVTHINCWGFNFFMRVVPFYFPIRRSLSFQKFMSILYKNLIRLQGILLYHLFSWRLAVNSIALLFTFFLMVEICSVSLDRLIA
jgi:hypothetical protein